jgi:hypothetical protein
MKNLNVSNGMIVYTLQLTIEQKLILLLIFMTLKKQTQLPKRREEEF